MIISFTYLISLEINILGCKMSQILHMLFTNEKDYVTVNVMVKFVSSSCLNTEYFLTFLLQVLMP